MIDAIFKAVVKMSVTASFAALVIIPLKMILQKFSFSKKTLMILWLVIALRLICPYAPQSNISLFNAFSKNTNQTKIKLPDQTITVLSHADSDNATYVYKNIYANTQKNPNTFYLHSFIWIAGICIMQCYGFVQSLRLKRKLKFSTKLCDNVYESEKFTSSFVFGFFKPKIYVPHIFLEEERNNMIIHEKTHIALWHNKLKVAAWIVLCIHWFNPFVWLMFRLFSNDMEYVCDESAIGKTSKKSYINSIVKADVCSKSAVLSPNVCCFSSLSKRRITNLAKYKKHSVLHTLPVFVIFVVATLMLSTNGIESKIDGPKNKSIQLSSNLQKTQIKENKASYDDNFSLHTDNSEEISVTKKEEEPDNIPICDSQFTVPNKPELGKYKSSEKSDIPYGGFQHLEPENITSENLTNELEQNSMTPSQENADLSQSYIKGEYVSSEEGVTIENVKCDNNGNISLYISLNTDSLFDVTVYDRDTKENVYQCNVLANGENAFSFLGFDKNKSYDITLKEPTKGQWKTEGSYIIY